MVAHVNFYEDIPEAQKRLNNTVVLYDGKPYYVLAVSNHKTDGKFRIYLDALKDEGSLASKKYDVPYHDYGDHVVGTNMDKWLDANPDKGIIRKRMDSPLFNKYRPFPMGMCNYGDNAYYLERSPTRHTQQGLTSSMIMCRQLSVLDSNINVPRGGNPINLLANEMYRAIINDYPDINECLSVLHSSDYATKGAAFHRNFALLSGPMSIVFLAYKDDIIGMLPTGDLSKVRIDKKFKHTLEVVQELGCFGEVDIIK
jgi:hypothetical protein